MRLSKRSCPRQAARSYDFSAYDALLLVFRFGGPRHTGHKSKLNNFHHLLYKSDCAKYNLQLHTPGRIIYERHLGRVAAASSVELRVSQLPLASSDNKMSEAFDYYLRVTLSVMAIVMLPFAWLESFCLYLLGIDDSTTFRMLPLQDAHPEFPAILPNGLALISILLIPHLVALERDPRNGMLVARILSPLIRRCSRRLRWLLMLPRIWLFLALFNYHMVSILHYPDQLFFIATKIGVSIWLL